MLSCGLLGYHTCKKGVSQSTRAVADIYRTEVTVKKLSKFYSQYNTGVNPPVLLIVLTL